MKIEKKHYWLIGAGALLLTATGIFFFQRRKKNRILAQEQLTDPFEDTDNRSIDPNDPNGTNSTERPAGIPPEGNSTVEKSPLVSVVDRIESKDGSGLIYILTLKDRPSATTLRVGERVKITGVPNLTGTKIIEKLFIDANGKLGGIYLRRTPDMPNKLMSFKQSVNDNPLLVQGTGKIFKLN